MRRNKSSYPLDILSENNKNKLEYIIRSYRLQIEIYSEKPQAQTFIFFIKDLIKNSFFTPQICL